MTSILRRLLILVHEDLADFKTVRAFKAQIDRFILSHLLGLIRSLLTPQIPSKAHRTSIFPLHHALS